MKKIILNVAIFATTVLVAISSANAQQGFQIGIQATPHLSWATNNDDSKDPDFEYVRTFVGSAGITSEYGFTDDIALGIDVLYSMQGQRFKLFGIENFKRTNYLKIPVMFVYNYKSSDMITMCYKIGPQLGILTKAKFTDKDGNNIVSDQTKSYQTAVFGGVASAGIGIKLMEKLRLDFAIRYDYDFTNAEDNGYVTHINHPLTSVPGNGISTTRATTNNSTVGITVGLRWLCGNMMK
jgi:hypothetical protein